MFQKRGCLAEWDRKNDLLFCGLCSRGWASLRCISRIVLLSWACFSRHDHPHRVSSGGQGDSCHCCTASLPPSPPQSPLPVLPRQLQQSQKEQQPQCNSNSYLARDLHCNVTQQELFSCLCNGLSLGDPGTFAPMLV